MIALEISPGRKMKGDLSLHPTSLSGINILPDFTTIMEIPIWMTS